MLRFTLLSLGEKLKKLLEGLLEEKAPGPSPSFSVFHLIKALELIAEGPIGRGKISEGLGTGEGATRTLIKRLKNADFIVTYKPGCTLTRKGEKFWKEFRLILPKKVKLEKSDLTLASCNVAILVKNATERIRAGVEQRDAAIMAGAKGATTLVCKDGRLVMPGISENLARDFPIAFNQISEKLGIEDKDVVVIGSAESWEKADYGALAAAWTLINNDCS